MLRHMYIFLSEHFFVNASKEGGRKPTSVFPQNIFNKTEPLNSSVNFQMSLSIDFIRKGPFPDLISVPMSGQRSWPSSDV